MSIIKIKKNENPYVQVDKRPINNAELSWQAKGLLVYLLSKPDDWEVKVGDLVKKATNGRDAVYSIINELLLSGYMERVPIRESGKFVKYDYIVHEEPIKVCFQPTEPFPEKPDTEKPDTEIPTHTNNEVTNKEDTKKRKIPKEKSLKVPVVQIREAVALTEEEHKKLLNDYGGTQTEWMLDKLNNYKLASGKSYKSDYRAILTWVVNAYEKDHKQGASYKNASRGTADMGDFMKQFGG